MSILIVDDVETNLIVLASVLETVTDRTVHAETCPLRAWERARTERFDLILVDYMMPGMDGVDFVTRIRSLDHHADTPLVMVTTSDQREVRLRAFEAGATDFITKPVDVAELKVRSRNLLRLSDAQGQLRNHAVDLQREVKRATEALAFREEEIIFRLSRAAERRDPETGDHIARMATLCAVIARRLGKPEAWCREIFLAAPMHDVGKIGVSDAILLKPGPLTGEERILMQEHARIGSEILSGSNSRLIQLASEIALTHHERYDGSGYPQGLAGEAIPLAGRIAAVADVYDALTSARPYKPAWPRERAAEHMRSQSGRHFDPACVAALLAHLEAGGGGEIPAPPYPEDEIILAAVA